MKVPNDIELNKLSDYLKNRAAGLNESLEKAIKQCGEKIRSDIQYEMAHTARNTSISYNGHNPSMPNNPPAPDTGNLRNSIRYEVHSENKEIYGIIGSTQKDPDYAVYTEYGTSRMAPRPWLRPAMMNNNDFIRSTLTSAVKKNFEGARS